MPDCCDPTPYRRFFNRKEAMRKVRSYRKRGLDPMATSMFTYLKSRDVSGLSILEVGGGIGAFQLELLKAGAANAINIELSGGYEEAAHALAKERGVEDRITRHQGDFVERAGEFGSVDIVVMNKVVCCYPWMERMMDAAVGRSGRYLALAVPREKWWTKLWFGFGNRYMAIRRCKFRGFVHSPTAIESVATEAGLRVCHRDNNLFWQALVLERPVPG